MRGKGCDDAEITQDTGTSDTPKEKGTPTQPRTIKESAKRNRPRNPTSGRGGKYKNSTSHFSHHMIDPIRKSFQVLWWWMLQRAWLRPPPPSLHGTFRNYRNHYITPIYTRRTLLRPSITTMASTSSPKSRRRLPGSTRCVSMADHWMNRKKSSQS